MLDRQASDALITSQSKGSKGSHSEEIQQLITQEQRIRKLCRELAWSPGALYGDLSTVPSSVASWYSREAECKAPG